MFVMKKKINNIDAENEHWTRFYFNIVAWKGLVCLGWFIFSVFVITV